MEEQYNRLEDETLPKLYKKRKDKVLTLKLLVQLSKMRNAKREELANNSVFIPYIYGPQEQQENAPMGGGLGL